MYNLSAREQILNGTDFKATAEDAARMSAQHKTKKRREHRKSHGKISFQDLSKMIAQRWKDLAEDQKQVFEEQAMLEKEERQQKMRQWRAHERKTTKSAAKKTSPVTVHSAAKVALKTPAQSLEAMASDNLFEAYESPFDSEEADFLANMFDEDENLTQEHTAAPISTIQSPVENSPEVVSASEASDSEDDSIDHICWDLLEGIGDDAHVGSMEPIAYL